MKLKNENISYVPLIGFAMALVSASMPLWAQSQFLEFGVVSCKTHPKQASAEMGVKNLSVKTVDTVRIQYNVLDNKNNIFSSDFWYFQGMRQGKTIVDKVTPIYSISCPEISAIEITSATCIFAGESGKYDCYDAIRPMSGALKVRK